MATHTCNTVRVGREIELRAWLWLTRHGYDVFDNIFPNGPVDIIALNPADGTVLKLEVRKARITPTGMQVRRLSREQIRLGVKLLVYRPDRDDFVLCGQTLHTVERERKAPVTRTREVAAAERRERVVALDAAEARQDGLRLALAQARR